MGTVRRRIAPLWHGALVFLTLCGGSYAAGNNQVVVDFEDMPPGGPPPGFTAGLTGEGRPVEWVVVEDETAPSGTKALAEVSGDETSYRFPLALYEGLEAEDVVVSVRFKPISGRVDQAAGLVVRAADANNYYIARANALEDNVRLYRVVDGQRQQFAGVDTEVPAGEWQTLELRAEGDLFEVFLDGRSLFTATDDTFGGPGKVGLWTKADSLTHFDDLTITPVP
jgi:hypothetical protein